MNAPVAQSRLHETTELRASVSSRIERSFLLFLVLFCVALFPVGLSLQSVRAARSVEPITVQAVPYGYTISLLMFAVPLTVLGFWAWRRRLSVTERRASGLALGAMIVLGFFLEWSLGSTCFFFPNPGATLGWRIPVLGGSSPIEEFLFFALGPPAILLGYLWADRDWMSAYHVRLAQETARGPVLSLNVPLTTAAVIILAGIVTTRWAAGIPGIPLYFVYLFIIPASACSLLLSSAGSAVNWRALSLVTALLLLVSIVWEANLGVPYGWWGYQNSAMLGVFIGPWSGLPIEEPFLWFVTAFTVVVWYEAARMRLTRSVGEDQG